MHNITPEKLLEAMQKSFKRSEEYLDLKLILKIRKQFKKMQCRWQYKTQHLNKLGYTKGN